MVVKFDFIKQLYQARLYVDNIVIKVFKLSTAVCVISVLLLFCNNIIIQGIAMSVIAAYIFYLMIEFIPSLLRAYENLPAMATTYRHLQLLLLNLDGIFLEAYKEVSGRGSSDPRVYQDVDLGVEYKTFFEKQFLFGVLNNFDLLKVSKRAGKNQIYMESFIEKWRNIDRHVYEISKTSYINNNELLRYSLDYLIKESHMAVAFAIYLEGRPGAWLVQVNFASILGFDQSGTSWDEVGVQNIKQIHEIAFQMYDILKKDERVKNIIFRPDFYKE